MSGWLKNQFLVLKSFKNIFLSLKPWTFSLVIIETSKDKPFVYNAIFKCTSVCRCYFLNVNCNLNCSFEKRDIDRQTTKRNSYRAWWKSQPDIDREKVSRRRRPSTILTFSWSTSTRLTFSTGWCWSDWAFLLVDVDQTELFYWSTSWSTVDAVKIHFSDVFITPQL